MKITVDVRAPADVAADLLTVPMTTWRKSSRLPSRIAALDRAARGAISAALESGDFHAKKGQTQLLYPGGRLKAKRLLLVGLGDAKKLDPEGLRRLGGRTVHAAMDRKAGKVAVVMPHANEDALAGWVQALAEGCVLGGYRLDDFKGSEAKPGGRVSAVSVLVERGAGLRDARAAARRGEALGDCQNVARRLSDMPANVLPPATLGDEAKLLARECGLKVKVLDVPALERNRMGAILAVGGGSENPPRVIVLEHVPPRRGRAAKSRSKKKTAKATGPAPFCIVGKGITFDSGGISIKPAPGMEEMKHDMSGAAAVFGAMRACALLELPYPVVGVIGAAENMPSGSAYRPGDVVTAMSGKTIEVLNTDAEGRVVLADVLHYARSEFDPCAIVDLATLTGACMIALGRWATGAFGNHEGLLEKLRAAGQATDERVWPMPLLDGHKEEIKSKIADIKNTGGREAGASTAAAFLSHFVGETPWVHLDIAGTGWTQKATPYHRGGATGVGVRLLLEALRDFDPGSLR